MAQPPAMPPATVQIVEQPAPRASRFRYLSERSVGSIIGVRSTADNKTFPTIRINNYIGQVTIVVSFVTKDEPYRPHPHYLVGRRRSGESFKNGVYTAVTTITMDANEFQFNNLGIQCVRKNDIDYALRQRAEVNADPFQTGFSHRNKPQSLNLFAVRLAFQVFVGSARVPLRPVLSDVIYNNKDMGELRLYKASLSHGAVAGGTLVWVQCDKVSPEKFVVVFYEKDHAGNVVWEEIANTVHVHKQVVIEFLTPKYYPPYYSASTHTEQIFVEFQLLRLSDNQRSNSLVFGYLPEIQVLKKQKPVWQSLLYAENWTPAPLAYASGQFQQQEQMDTASSNTPPQYDAEDSQLSLPSLPSNQEEDLSDSLQQISISDLIPGPQTR